MYGMLKTLAYHLCVIPQYSVQPVVVDSRNDIVKEEKLADARDFADFIIYLFIFEFLVFHPSLCCPFGSLLFAVPDVKYGKSVSPLKIRNPSSRWNPSSDPGLWHAQVQPHVHYSILVAFNLCNNACLSWTQICTEQVCMTQYLFAPAPFPKLDHYALSCTEHFIVTSCQTVSPSFFLTHFTQLQTSENCDIM